MEAENKVMDSIPVFSPHAARLKIKDKDPDYKYRWVNTNRDRIQFMKELGYEMVYTEDNETESEKKVSRVVNDVVLMRCPREMFEHREQIRRVRSRQMLESPRSKVKSTAESLGVEATDSTREYRGPLSSAMAEPTENKPGEGTITREQVQQQFNANKE